MLKVWERYCVGMGQRFSYRQLNIDKKKTPVELNVVSKSFATQKLVKKHKQKPAEKAG